MYDYTMYCLWSWGYCMSCDTWCYNLWIFDRRKKLQGLDKRNQKTWYNKSYYRGVSEVDSIQAV